MNITKKRYKQSIAHKTDVELVVEYRETLNTEVIGELFIRYKHIVFGIALKYMKNTSLAQDVLLDVFDSLFNHLIKYKIDDFKNWLLTVTRNHCFKVLKENTRTSSLESMQDNKILSVEFMETEDEIALSIDKDVRLKRLEEALLELKSEQRQCVSLFYLESKSYQEISHKTGFEIKKVKSYIQNGKRNLQNLMGG